VSGEPPQTHCGTPSRTAKTFFKSENSRPNLDAGFFFQIDFQGLGGFCEGSKLTALPHHSSRRFLDYLR